MTAPVGDVAPSCFLGDLLAALDVAPPTVGVTQAPAGTVTVVTDAPAIPSPDTSASIESTCGCCTRAAETSSTASPAMTLPVAVVVPAATEAMDAPEQSAPRAAPDAPVADLPDETPTPIDAPTADAPAADVPLPAQTAGAATIVPAARPAASRRDHRRDGAETADTAGPVLTALAPAIAVEPAPSAIPRPRPVDPDARWAAVPVAPPEQDVLADRQAPPPPPLDRVAVVPTAVPAIDDEPAPDSTGPSHPSATTPTAARPDGPVAAAMPGTLAPAPHAPVPPAPRSTTAERSGAPASLGMIGVDRVRFAREQAPSRELQRLSIDLDGAQIAMRVRGERVSVDVISDPSGTLGAAWARGVERTLDQAVRATHDAAAPQQEPSARGDHGATGRERSGHGDQPGRQRHGRAFTMAGALTQETEG